MKQYAHAQCTMYMDWIRSQWNFLQRNFRQNHIFNNNVWMHGYLDNNAYIGPVEAGTSLILIANRTKRPKRNCAFKEVRNHRMSANNPVTPECQSENRKTMPKPCTSAHKRFPTERTNVRVSVPCQGVHCILSAPTRTFNPKYKYN